MSGAILADLNVHRQSLLTRLNDLESEKAQKVEAGNKVKAEINTITNTAFSIVAKLTGKEHSSLKSTHFENLFSQFPGLDAKRTELVNALKTCKNIDENAALRLKGDKLKSCDSGFLKNIMHGSRYKSESDAAKQRFSPEGTAVTRESLKNTLMHTDTKLGLLHTLKNDYSSMLAKKGVQRSIEQDINKIDQELRATASKLKEVDKKRGESEAGNRRDDLVNTTDPERPGESPAERRADNLVPPTAEPGKDSEPKHVRISDEQEHTFVHVKDETPPRSEDVRACGPKGVNTHRRGVEHYQAVRTPAEQRKQKIDGLIKAISKNISEEKYRAYSDDSSGLVGIPDDARIKKGTSELVYKMLKFKTLSSFCDSEVSRRKTADRQVAEYNQHKEYQSLKLRSESSIRKEVEAECAQVRKYDTKGVFAPGYWK